MNQRKGKIKKCEICKKEFYVAPSHENERRFCSKKCAAVYHLTKIIKQCPNCNKEFYTVLSQKNQKHCSHKCRNAAKYKFKRLKTGAIKNCLICGKFFYAVPSLIDKRKFCSCHCKGVWHMRCRKVGTTGIEQKIRMLLVRGGLSFKMQKPIGSYRVDFFLRPNYIIEADGEFWHKSVITQAHDKKRDSILKSKGYQSFTFARKIDKPRY